MMAPKKNKLPIEKLLQHLDMYKDAVIVLGPDILGEIKQYNLDETTKDLYNRKLMVREPQKFWDFYTTNLMKPLAITNGITSQINKLLERNIHSTIIDTNMVKTIINSDKRKDLISPNGKNDKLECVKCHKIYEAHTMMDRLTNVDEVIKCDCGGQIKPTVLYYGEKYNMELYRTIKESIFTEIKNKPSLTTHTLMFIGCDFTDTLVSEIIDSYDAIKDDNHYTVIITDKKNRDDLIYYNPEFGVSDDIDQAIDRLIKILI